MFNGWIDTHTHLNFLKERTPLEAIKEAKTKGIEQFINIGTNSEDHPVVLDLAKKHPEVFCTLGVHPHDAKDFKKAKDFMLKNLENDKVVAVGEIGLDFYYDNSPREEQRSVFLEQMEIAQDLRLPVQIHTRDAEPETIEVLKLFSGKVKGILHCFSGSRHLAEEALAHGFNLSFSGIVTFKSAEDLRATVKEVTPIDRIHVETDAPYLAPSPYRGKENHSALMINTAQLLADLKEVSLEDLGHQTMMNTKGLFTKINSSKA
jgi:TatD DNase family protein